MRACPLARAGRDQQASATTSGKVGRESGHGHRVVRRQKATITAEQEDAFNRWYNQEHCPQLLRFQGAVSARRYKAIMGEDKYQYMAMYEFESEATFQRFLESGHLEELKREYDLHFADVSERARSAYVQVWP